MDNWQIRTKLSVLKPRSQLLSVGLQLRVFNSLIEHIDFIHRNNEFVHQDFSKYDALSCLCLDQLLRVHHKHHKVDNASSANYGFHQTGVTGAVNKGEL